ncbi:MAG: DUF2298 domain-containing protein [Anaerolineales bacterium]|nr:DUF2298 domain-containing protein [Anaerolineales bacterium]
MTNKKYSWLYDLLFLLILALAGYLRIAGYNWGEGQHQHPDELFLTGVLENLRAHACIDSSVAIDACPEDNQRWMTLGEYFDSSASTLNPYNRGYSFYVYGDLPLTLTRVLMEAVGKDDLGSVKYFSRQMSAWMDLLTVFLLYFIVSRLYGRKIGLLATAFSALAVMQIQQAHFFTVDLFVNFFMFLTVFFAVWILQWKPKTPATETEDEAPPRLALIKHPLLYLSIGFGIALGMAMASKINAAALAFLLPFAFFVRWLVYERRKLTAEEWTQIVVFLVVGGMATLLSFRVFQPYAFDGLWLSKQWVNGILEQRGQATGKADLPWNLQWAKRTHLYSFENLTVWGLGLPLGILAWLGFLLMGWRIVKGNYRHLLLWGWTAFYFGWQSIQFNPTMRYQLPIYPLLCMTAAWGVFEIGGRNGSKLRKNFAFVLGAAVLISTAVWAFAFQSIYLRDEPRIAASRWLFQNAPSAMNLSLQTADGAFNQPLSFPPNLPIVAGEPYEAEFTPLKDGDLSGVFFPHAKEEANFSTQVVVTLSLAADPDQALTRASAMLNPSPTADPRGEALTFAFDPPVALTKGTAYRLRVETLGETLTLVGSAIANETDYDYGLPFRVDGYDPYGSLYSNADLTLQVYWRDDENKIERYLDALSNADYLAIPTNHQYAQITRLPERYPLTTLYYRELIGCPESEDIIACYYRAEPGMYQGKLGYDLVAVFTDYPTLGPLVINDSAAEEAFTFYDHPKVFIFKKSANFDAAKVRAIFNQVDLSKVVELLPPEFSNFKTLMLPQAAWANQRASGTWSQLFDYDWLQNKYPVVGLAIWYLFIFILGACAYPIARLALPSFKAYAYALGRIVGLALMAWLAWMGGSLGVGYTRLSVGVAFLIVAALGVGLWMRRKEEFKDDWNRQRQFFVVAEIVFLAFFVIDLIIRIGNPDLWHPSKGGERPMDFSYFNAILKSASFPPYDPWYAGGYINYYYYGFVLAGAPVKLLGIVPSIAYNFLLPTWFGLTALGAFSVAYAALSKTKLQGDENPAAILNLKLVGGLSASLLMVFLGNLGTIQMLFNAAQRIVAPNGNIPADAGFFQHWAWALQGVWQMLAKHASLPIGRGEWYWNPSRVIPSGPGNEITEFPLFTFLYSDLHAHMLVMPLALFIIAWALAFVMARARLTRGEWIASFVVGALMIGALKPTNTWDLYTYYLLAALALGYTIFRYANWRGWFNLPPLIGKAALALGAMAALYILSSLLYAPFSKWFGQGYNSISFWTASRTPFSSYFTQWGLFLFIIAAWLIWETREWMAATPVSSLGKLRRYALWIELALAGVIALLVFFLIEKAYVGLLALPLAVWSATLMLRPDQPDEKRFVLFVIGTALTITIAVEFIALVGDIGRMNTIFKLYLQAWALFAVGAAAAFGWLLPVIFQWRRKQRRFFQTGLYILLACAFLFTLTATADKMGDRLNPDAPHSLDSMEYMAHSQLWDGETMELAEDYRAIRWMQDNVQGSPVIVEANCSEYRWCTRFTIYTGLPGVVGWNWHQRQQRGMFAPQVQARVDEVVAFYKTDDVQEALTFLKKYDARYIVVGQLERNVYPVTPGEPDGLTKFAQFDGVFWDAVYHDGSTTIYSVRQQP